MKPVSRQHHGLGSAVCELRTAKGLSQEDLGLEAGLDRTYVGGIERGERNPSFGSLVKIAEALGVSVSEMISLGERLTLE